MGFDPISAGVGLAMNIPAIWNQFGVAKKQRKAGENYYVPPDVNATVSDYEKQNEAYYKNAYNTGMMPGQAIQQQQLIDQGVNTAANVGRNTTSAAQRLKLAGSIQGQQNAGMQNLQAQFGQQKMGILGGLSNALGRMTNEENKVFADKRYVHERELKTKSDLLQSAMINKQQGFGQLANIGAMVGTGAFGNVGDLLKGKGGKTTPTATQPMTAAMIGNPDFSMYPAGGANTWEGLFPQQPRQFLGGLQSPTSRPNTSGFNFGYSNPYPQLTNFLNQQYQQRQQYP